MRINRFAAVVLAIVFGFALSRHQQTLNAQGAVPSSFTVVGAHTLCTAPLQGVTRFCFASDGAWQSLNGAAYTQLGAGAPASPVSLTLNGVTKTLPAAFTVGAIASNPSVTVSVPTVTVNAN